MQQQSSNMLATQDKSFSLTPQSLDEALRFADILATSSIVPKDFQGNAGNILVAVQWGMELGLQPMQAMQNIAVINGRPALWGDAVLAIVLSSPHCEDVVEYYEGEGDDFAAVCIAKRKGKADKTARFSVADARAAGLLDKTGPWKQYRDRMMKMRARAFAVRDQFADVLKGMAVAEELQDMPVREKDMGPVVHADQKPQQPATYPEADFAKNFPAWSTVIKSGRKSPEEVIATVEAKAPLTEEQRKQILAVEVELPEETQE